MSKDKICYMSLLYSVADKPLDLWSKHVSYKGKVCRVKDDLLDGDRVIEITGSHDNTIPTSITIPAETLDILNVKLPILVLVVKNLNLQFKLEVQVIDKEQYRRRFSFMTYNTERLPNIDANVARIPLTLEKCWNLLEINLQTLCHEAYRTGYEALQRITIYSNCHLRRVYLQDRHYNDDEIPVEMYQAFFDMYMLKRGINFIEKACQTEECHTGPIEQSQLHCFTKDNSISTSPTKNLSKNAHSTKRLKNSSPPVNLNSCNPRILKRNHISLDALNEAIKVRNQDVFTRQSEYFAKSWINNLIVENKLEKANRESDTMGKAEQQHIVKMHKAGNSLLNINVKIKNQSKPAYSVDLKRIAKSQFLKMHISEVFKDNRFRSQKIQNANDTYINSRNCTLSNNADNVQTGKYNSTDTKFGVSAVDSPPAFKLDLLENIKLDKTSSNMSNIQNNDHVISKYKFIRESKRSITNCLRSLLNIEESAEDTIEDTPIPFVIEKETKLNEMKS